MPSKYEQRRRELEPKLRAVIGFLRTTFPGIQLDEDEIVRTQLSDARFELQERAKQLGLGTTRHAERKKNLYREYERSYYTPKAFARCVTHLIKEEKDSPENQAYNEKFFKDLARDDEMGIQKRRQLAIEVMNISANIPYENLENDMSMENLVDFSLKHYDASGIAMELNHVSADLEFPFTDKEKYNKVRRLGETIGGSVRDLAFLAQDDSFLTFPFAYLNFDQMMQLNANIKYQGVQQIPELGGMTGNMLGSYFQARSNLNELPNAIQTFKNDYPQERPVFTNADLGPTYPQFMPKGGFETYKRDFFAAADELNQYTDPAFDELKAYVGEIRQLFDTTSYITEEQCRDITERRGPITNLVRGIQSNLDPADRETLKPLFAKLTTSANLVSINYKQLASLMDYQNIDRAAKELFGVNAAYKLTFGPSETGRVGHILSDKEKKPVYTSGVEKVSKIETYDNEGDRKNKKFFEKTAKRLCELYAFYPEDESLRNVVKKGSAYLKAAGRSAQQNALKEFNAAAEKYEKDFSKLDADKQTERAKGMSALNEIRLGIKERSTGSLEVPVNREVMPEPGDMRLGHIGIWSKSNDQLFPHTPSPNDIKQGLGVDDCYMLAALSHIAATDPKAITDAMKDNGDGTVSVRFHDRNKEPVFVTVNKTVNKVAGANVYASSSLWVQMMEKAYIGYRNKVYGMENSFNSINRRDTAEFMNAFGTEKYFNEPGVFGTGELNAGDLYKMDSQGNTPNHPEGYLDVDNAVYDFLNEQVTVGKKTITVGVNARYNKELDDYAKSHGIRTGHAYAVMKTFEQNVNGKMKKFVQLRDPYATFRSTYDKEGKLVDDSHEITATTGAGMDNMGTFNLELVDFQKMFNSFAGIPESSKTAFIAKMKVCRNYFKDPLSPEEMEACKLPDAPKPEGDRLVDLRNAPPESIESRLNSRTDFNEMFRKVTDVASDLASTDEWFVWSNTKKFTDMRDAVNDLQKTMAQFKDKAPTPQQFETICNKFRNAAEKASAYTEKKLSEIKESGKDPSLRAIHRLTSSFNIKRLCEGQGLLPAGKNQFSERIGLVVHDINERCERFRNNQNVPHDNKTVEQMQSFSEVITNYIAKNPKLINENLMTTKAFRKLTNNIREMKAGNIKKPEPEKQKNVQKENKPEDKKPDLSDFEVMDFK